MIGDDTRLSTHRPQLKACYAMRWHPKLAVCDVRPTPRLCASSARLELLLRRRLRIAYPGRSDCLRYGSASALIDGMLPGCCQPAYSERTFFAPPKIMEDGANRLGFDIDLRKRACCLQLLRCEDLHTYSKSAAALRQAVLRWCIWCMERTEKSHDRIT